MLSNNVTPRERLFPERHISIRVHGRMRQITLSGSLQIVGLCGLLAGTSAVAYLAASHFLYDRLVAEKEAEVLKAEMSNADLRELVIRLQERLSATRDELDRTRTKLADGTTQTAGLRDQIHAIEARVRTAEEGRDRLAAARDELQQRSAVLEEMLSAKNAQLASLGRSADTARGELKKIDQQRAGLTDRIRELETELQSVAAKSTQVQTALDAAERKLQVATAERDKAVTERDRLRGRVAELERRVAEADADAGKASPSRAAQASSPVLPAAASRTEASAVSGWSEIERVLASAGVDVPKLIARFNTTPSGQGGPFVALGAPGRKPAAAADPEELIARADGLQKALKSLPLSPPLASYQLESRFGVRTDPLNHRQSIHTGLDFSAPYRSAVYNTAPGTVIYAGPKGDYGKVVEVDHGSGIVTRYAHLHRTTVTAGSILGGRQQIGELGSTGRSTGPHVHYEVIVNGVPQDPEKFLVAGRNVVPVAAK
ncbi:MAG TPA: peptidoglycan DD-metalloendopeptidase family protein [Stellaceae bacterium]